MSVEVLVTGTFNILHPGHVRLLEFASRFGSVTVGLNSDEYLYNKYGESNTIPLVDRTYVLMSNKYVENVLVFTEENPSDLILKVKPKIYIKGPDYKNQAIPEIHALDRVGAQYIVQPDNKDYNSSELIKNLKPKVFNKLKKYI